MSTRRICDLLNLSHVLHWHTVRTRRKPTVAEHSFRVAVIAMELADRLYKEHCLYDHTWEDDYMILQAALVHDGPESETGDLPHTTKAQLPNGLWKDVERTFCPSVTTFSDSITDLVKIADLMECYMFICEEGIGTEAHNAEIATRSDIDLAVAAAMAKFGWKPLTGVVWGIIADSRLPSDTRHNAATTNVATAATEDLMFKRGDGTSTDKD
jgi:5'-deoxynucleotidase YfbR-like HD superfamily hydrolase